ncbi:GntR family transcriptional regulator [Sporolactobacillus terrae]|uniref:GntR family transcriptional regulator n=1 Tax=Sporolactobacillus terrae TaxID=269673 RepID=UPI00048E30B6|nr:GntR family transcriptional regulator [Sporolactobacillus terrae]
MNKKIPLYIQIHDYLLKSIQNKTYVTGALLPSEAELAKKYKVSLITIRRAMQELANEGWVKRQAGKGTFASMPTKINQPVGVLTSFTTDMEELGIKPSSTLLTQETIPAGEHESKMLEVKLGTPLFHLYRIRQGDGLPILLENVYVPLNIFPNLTNMDFSDQSFYKALTENRIELTRSTQEFEPVILTHNQALLLQVHDLIPAFLRKAVSYSKDRPIEYVESIYRKDRFRFIVETGRYSPKLVLISPKKTGR